MNSQASTPSSTPTRGKQIPQPLVFIPQPDPDEFPENPSPLIQKSPTPLPILLRPRVPQSPTAKTLHVASSAISTVLQSMLPTCRLPLFPPKPPLSPSRRRQLSGTLFGPRHGRVTLALHPSPSSPPTLLLELAVHTSHLIAEMAAGAVRILLESDKSPGRGLWEEPVWTMYCNGRRSGFAVARAWGEADAEVFRAVKSVTAGAGVIPATGAGVIPGGGGKEKVAEAEEVMFMRARFERVVGSKDSEAFYMVSPDGTSSGQELCVYLLRL